MLPVYGDVDVARLRRNWPDSEEAQNTLLLSSPPPAWRLQPDLDNHLNECSFSMLAAKTLDTKWGKRWFHVWKEPVYSNITVVKQPAPKQMLIASCSFSIAQQSLQATFTLLSGRVLATRAFTNTFCRNPLLLEDLEQAALEEALQQGLLETDYQNVTCSLEGFTCALPGGLLLWHDAVTAESFQEWLAYLRTLSESQLEHWDYYLMDVAASFSSSDDEISDEDTAVEPGRSSLAQARRMMLRAPLPRTGMI